MKILYVGPDYPGSNGTLWRNAFLELGCEVRTVDEERLTATPPDFQSRLQRKLRGRPSEIQLKELNRAVLLQASEFEPDMVFLIKGYYVLPETISALRTRRPVFAYMNDDMFLPGIHTFTFFENIKLIDCILTTKSFSIREYHDAGAPLAVYIANSFDPKVHYPARPSDDEYRIYAADASFIGWFSPSKAQVLSQVPLNLPEATLKIWGNWSRMNRVDQWPANRRWKALNRYIQGKPVFCDEMGKAIQSSDISLGLLNRDVRDLHTSRSFEIPACGGFMLADRTEEHRMYFEEDVEAVYFGSAQELVDKIRFYLAHDDLRRRIARAGYERCLRSGATYVDRARHALDLYRSMRPQFVTVPSVAN